MIKTRNRSPLFSLVTVVKANIHPVSLSASAHSGAGAKNYPGLIDDLRAKAEHAGREFGEAARNTEFVDTNQLTDDQKKDIIQAGRDNNFEKYENATDDAVLKDLLDFRYARQMPGTNMVLYNTRDLDKASVNLTQSLLAHELGHHVLELRGIWNQREPDADEIGARIMGPQAFVNGLAELARLSPLSNNSRFQKGNDHNIHRTDYERAVEVKNRFPEKHVDFSHFPKASGLDSGKQRNAAPSAHMASPQF